MNYRIERNHGEASVYLEFSEEKKVGKTFGYTDKILYDKNHFIIGMEILEPFEQDYVEGWSKVDIQECVMIECSRQKIKILFNGIGGREVTEDDIYDFAEGIISIDWDKDMNLFGVEMLPRYKFLGLSCEEDKYINPGVLKKSIDFDSKFADFMRKEGVAGEAIAEQVVRTVNTCKQLKGFQIIEKEIVIQDKGKTFKFNSQLEIDGYTAYSSKTGEGVVFSEELKVGVRYLGGKVTIGNEKTFVNYDLYTKEVNALIKKNQKEMPLEEAVKLPINEMKIRTYKRLSEAGMLTEHKFMTD